MAATAARQVAVFWDFGKVIGYSLELTYGSNGYRSENCRPPFSVSGNRLMDNIRRLFEGYGSIMTFKAYVDLSVECINPKSYSLHSELQSSGLTLIHCPHNGKKEVADKMMLGMLL